MKNRCEAPIGVFDSGVGGLTVVREIMRNLPSEKIVYFGDTARVPYGSKSKETVIRYSRQIIRFLKTQGVKAIVMILGAIGFASMWAAVFADVGVSVIAILNAVRALQVTKDDRVGNGKAFQKTAEV